MHARISEYGPGDHQTWGPATNHPLDPRNDGGDSDDAQTRADGYLLDGHKVDDLLGEVCCIEPSEVFRPALLALMEGNAEPLRDLIRKRALIEAQREIDDEQSDAEEEARDAKYERHVEFYRERGML